MNHPEEFALVMIIAALAFSLLIGRLLFGCWLWQAWPFKRDKK